MKVTSDTSDYPIATAGGNHRAWPPGFRFHPTDEELILYHLKWKICRRRFKLDIIAEVDVYKWDPEELPGLSILKTGDRQWFFYSPRDRKYPNGGRSSRATRQGYWKATGKDRNITCRSRSVGIKKTLVYYKGRAPNGERTDWVMHEYTMDEEELKRCQNVQDYYALYKVYKKSGAGPKNGEQYGAPFNEEEWEEDDYVDFNTSNQESISKLTNEEAPNNLMVDAEIQSPLIDIQELMKLVPDEPAFEHLQVDQAYTIYQIFEEERASTMMDPSCVDGKFSEPIRVLPPDVEGSFNFTQSAESQLQSFAAHEVTSAPDVCEQFHVQGNFNITQLTTSQLQLDEGPEVTFAPDVCEQFHVNEEDFLEIDDLIGPEPTFSNFEIPGESLQFQDVDGLGEFDLYHDAAMFLCDVEPLDHVTVSDSYMNILSNDMVNELDYQLQPSQTITEGNSSELSSPDQRSHAFIPAASNKGVVYPPSSGVSGSTNLVSQTNQNQSVRSPGSPFSSALWAFVESIPSSPASAAENALVNRAFERMSSFSRLRIDAINTSIAAPTRRAKNNWGFILFALLGVLCAILWFCVGEVRIFGRSISW